MVFVNSNLVVAVHTGPLSIDYSNIKIMSTRKPTKETDDFQSPVIRRLINYPSYIYATLDPSLVNYVYLVCKTWRC